jgi:hypothetical protein
MRSLCLLVAASSILGAHATAQNKSLLFTGRFPFVSLDAVNERPGGSVTRLEEYDLSFVTPAAGAFARSLHTATAIQAHLGDGDNDGNYTKFYNFKTYFQNIQFGGLFVKHADKANLTVDKVFFTVRDDLATHQFEVFTTNGSAVQVLVPGDFVRFRPNGNVETFVTAAQLQVAAGPPNAGGVSVHGAHALCQDAAGNLYYAPVAGGHWVNGNGPTPVFANDGAIVMIDAVNITYDAAGNVQSFAPNSARILFEEVNGGPSPSPRSTRTMVVSSGGMNRDGVPLVATGIFGKVSGLDLDPNGGTTVPAYPDAGGAYNPVPNLLFCSDAGSYAGTIFSTAGIGSIATINGVLCGSLTAGVPANGSWLGVQFDYANFQPSLMALQVVDAIGYEPLVLDMPNFGGVAPVGSQPTLDIDAHGQAGMLTFVLAGFIPGAPGQFLPSLPISLLPPVLTPDSYPWAFVPVPAATLGFLVHGPNGYGTLSLGNPNTGPSVTGIGLVLQAAGLTGTAFQLSNPVVMQLK